MHPSRFYTTIPRRFEQSSIARVARNLRRVRVVPSSELNLPMQDALGFTRDSTTRIQFLKAMVDVRQPRKWRRLERSRQWIRLIADQWVVAAGRSTNLEGQTTSVKSDFLRQLTPTLFSISTLTHPRHHHRSLLSSTRCSCVPPSPSRVSPREQRRWKGGACYTL